MEVRNYENFSGVVVRSLRALKSGRKAHRGHDGYGVAPRQPAFVFGVIRHESASRIDIAPLHDEHVLTGENGFTSLVYDLTGLDDNSLLRPFWIVAFFPHTNYCVYGVANEHGLDEAQSIIAVTHGTRVHRLDRK